MTIKVFVTNTTANRNVRDQQLYLDCILHGFKIDHRAIDISDPIYREERELYLQNGVRDENGKPILPQVFNDEQACGSFDEFERAIECEKLEVFLKFMTEEEWNAKRAKKSETEQTTSVRGSEGENKDTDDESEEEDSSDESETESVELKVGTLFVKIA
ncbi:hypothetical protein ACOME3_003569 [Neoechinorhynchus agilis]